MDRGDPVFEARLVLQNRITERRAAALERTNAEERERTELCVCLANVYSTRDSNRRVDSGHEPEKGAAPTLPTWLSGPLIFHVPKILCKTQLACCPLISQKFKLTNFKRDKLSALSRGPRGLSSKRTFGPRNRRGSAVRLFPEKA